MLIGLALLLGARMWSWALPLLSSGWLLGVAYDRNWFRVREPVRVAGNEEGITVGHEHVPRGRIQEGLEVPGTPPRVLLRLRGLRPSITLETRTKREARALLRALRLDAAHALASFQVPSRLYSILGRHFGWGAIASLLLGAAITWLLVTSGLVPVQGHVGPVFGVIITLFFVPFVAQTRVDVGADGIALRWMGTRRFIGFGRIAKVASLQMDTNLEFLRLVLETGEEVSIPVAKPRQAGSKSDLTVIERRIREAHKAFRAGETAAAPLLRRGERTLAEWITALRSIGAGANASLRIAPVPREYLLRIVEDATAASTDRVAAVVALGVSLDRDTRARIDAVAEAIAAPKLRIAVQKAVSAEGDAEIEAAMEEFFVQSRAEQVTSESGARRRR
jgi:hypothetical protein